MLGVVLIGFIVILGFMLVESILVGQRFRDHVERIDQLNERIQDLHQQLGETRDRLSKRIAEAIDRRKS